MKTIISIAVMLLTTTGFIENTVNAHVQPREQLSAKRIIRKTAVVIHAAQRKVRENKNFTGDLSKAVRHQRFAKKLYASGKYRKAVYQSRIARNYAIKAIKANRGEDIADYRFAPEDEEMFKNAPSDAELEKELENQMPDDKLKDEDVIKSEEDIDLDIK